MQQFCKHDTAATKRCTIQEGVRYSVGREVIKRRLQSIVQKTEVKIRLPGRAVRNTDIEDKSL
jgi:hypothetical protein